MSEKEIVNAIKVIKAHCLKHRTCKGCNYNKKFKGCYFRQGRIPREWKTNED